VSTILIGVNASERSADAIAFGRRLASVSDARVLLACVDTDNDRFAGSRDGDRELLRKAAHDVEHGISDRLEGIAADRVVVRTMANPSPAHALHNLAESERADVIVVGSSHTSSLGRIAPGSTGERLLHGAPCAVAVVPHGYRTRADDPFHRIGVAYDGSEEATAAVGSGVELARALGAELELIGVATGGAYGAPGMMGGIGYVAPPEDVDRIVQEGLDRLRAGLPSDVTAHSMRFAGDPAQKLAERSAALDLLVAGSRGYGPLRSVLVGGVSGRLMRMAQCPVIVLPRGADTPLGALFGSTASTVAS
jgi:nucleotide-binding universal stress UspA family protein